MIVHLSSNIIDTSNNTTNNNSNNNTSIIILFTYRYFFLALKLKASSNLKLFHLKEEMIMKKLVLG